MSILSLESVSKSYGDRVLLNDVSLRLDAGERLALIGDNGSGKSTLLRLICGDEQADSGQIQIAQNCIWAKLSQHMEELSDLRQHSLADQRLEQVGRSLEEAARGLAHASADPASPEYREAEARYNQAQRDLEQLDSPARPAELAAFLAGLGLKGDVLERPLASLSGGERMRVALARILSRPTDLLFLDEPTNHLDIPAMAWLETFLTRRKGALLFISHDRSFIDHCATSVAELKNGILTVYKGNYQAYEAERNTRQAWAVKEVEALEKEKTRERERVQTLFSHRNMSAFHAREKKVQKLEERLAEARRAVQKSHGVMNFRFVQDPERGDPDRVILKVDDLDFVYEDSAVGPAAPRATRGRRFFTILPLNLRPARNWSWSARTAVGRAVFLSCSWANSAPAPGA